MTEQPGEPELRILAAIDRQRRRDGIWDEIGCELDAQDEKWGRDREHPNGTGQLHQRLRAAFAKSATNQAADRGRVTWQLIADEEFAEASAETEPAKIRAELIQTAAVLVQWIDAIDRQMGEH